MDVRHSRYCAGVTVAALAGGKEFRLGNGLGDILSVGQAGDAWRRAATAEKSDGETG